MHAISAWPEFCYKKNCIKSLINIDLINILQIDEKIIVLFLIELNPPE